MTDFDRTLQYEFEALRAEYRQTHNLDVIRAILGDGNGVLYDSNNPNSGYVWVRQLTSNGLSTAQRVRSPYQGAPVIMANGTPVILKRDSDKQLFVAGPDFQGSIAVGVNPAVNNASDPQSNKWVNQGNIITAGCYPTIPPSLKVWVNAWIVVINNVAYQLPGVQADLTALVPAAGNHCLATVFVKSDFASVEAVASTAQSTLDPLDITDFQETLNGKSLGSIPNWSWKLQGGQTTIADTDSFLDCRSLWNTNDLPQDGVEYKLATVTGVDMNTATPTALYTVPTGRSCIITKVVVRAASTSLTTASYSFGFNSATFNNVVADATHTELTGSTLYTALAAKTGATRGAAADVFKVLMNTLQGGAATTTMDVFGYLF